MDYFLISNMFPNDTSPGYGSFVKNVVDGLSRNGISCKYSALIIGRPSSFGQKCMKYIRFYVKILRCYFKTYDFLYIHYPNHALPCLLPCFLVKKQRVVVNLHGEDLLYKNKGLSYILGKLNDFFLKKVDAIVVPSYYYKDIVLKRIENIDKQIIVSPSGGINSTVFYPKHFNANDNKLLHLGYVGRIDPNKGWREFIEAIRLLSKSLRFKATIIGAGSDVDELQQYLLKYNFLNIEYIPKVAQNSLRDYYSNFDLLLFPSMRKEESLGLVGIEAMACGTPVIGSKIGGIPSYLIDRYNGFLVEPGNAEHIVNCVLEYNQLSLCQREEYYNNCINKSKEFFSEKVILDLSLSFIDLIDN